MPRDSDTVAASRSRKVVKPTPRELMEDAGTGLDYGPDRTACRATSLRSTVSTSAAMHLLPGWTRRAGRFVSGAAGYVNQLPTPMTIYGTGFRWYL
jgi:hypothetical protein